MFILEVSWKNFATIFNVFDKFLLSFWNLRRQKQNQNPVKQKSTMHSTCMTKFPNYKILGIKDSEKKFPDMKRSLQSLIRYFGCKILCFLQPLVLRSLSYLVNQHLWESLMADIRKIQKELNIKVSGDLIVWKGSNNCWDFC